MRTEHDFLGAMEVPDDAYYGVQTMRAIENFYITGQRLDPTFIIALAQVKKAAALANMDTGRSGRRGHIDQHEHERGALQPRARAARRGKGAL